MFFKIVILLLLLLLNFASSQLGNFIFNGIVNIDGTSQFTPEGLIRLTNGSSQQIGRAFYSNPLQFKNSTNGNVFSFSTNFIFAIVPEYFGLSGHGMAFVITPTNKLSGLPSQYLGIFNPANIGNSSNHVVAIKLDTIQSLEFGDINNNNVGIDINGLKSIKSATAGYFTDDNGGEFKNLSLNSGDPMQVSVEYDGVAKQLNVTLFPINILKPHIPLLSLDIDLSPIILHDMYVGFSSSTGSVVASQYVLGWSFNPNGKAQALNVSRLPSLPWKENSKKKSKSKALMTIGLPLIATVFVVLAISWAIFIKRRKLKFAEVLEDWELEYGPQRIAYKDLTIATKGFTDNELLGSGGFGRVYRGILPASKIKVAVKRISHESRQGMKEFIAEIVSLGRLRHRNLVPLLGYCRRKGELLLVYELMPNGSLDKFIYNQPNSLLNWSQRLRIIKGVASGLLYLHEDWEQVVIHRDIKASNVLLDNELNGRLGDFGLARLYGHGTDPQTTHVAGTLGYIAPELSKTGKASTRTDVFAFGVFMLEVACGRRPIEQRASLEESVLVDWVLECWTRGAILKPVDQKLGNDYAVAEMELVLKLGLLCSHPSPMSRPSMRRVMQLLDGDVPLLELSPDCFIASVSELENGQGFDDLTMPNQSLILESILSGGR